MSHDGNHPHDPLHVAIIMDGNGRWAARRGLPRTAGHRAGADAVRRVVEAAPTLGITTLTTTSTSSSAPAAKSGCRTFCSGRQPTPSSASSTRCGRTLAPTICARRLLIFMAASAASAGWEAPRDSLPPNNC